MERIHKDECSHFLLRAALCSSRDQREFLLRTESQLLAARLSQAESDAVLTVLDDCDGLEIEALKRSEIAEVWSKVKAFHFLTSVLVTLCLKFYQCFSLSRLFFLFLFLCPLTTVRG